MLKDVTIEIAGTDRQLQLCHYPFAGDSKETDRYSDRRPTDRGQWLACGHVHDRWRQRGRMINVGVDAWGGHIVTEGDLVALINAGPNDLSVLGWEIAAEDSPFGALAATE